MKDVLIIIPYDEIFPPMNGGMLRCFHLLRQLARYFRVTAVVHQDATTLIKAVDQFPELRNCEIISTKDHPTSSDIFSLLPSRINKGLRFRYWKRTLKGTTDDNFLKYYPVLTQLLKKKKFEYVFLENLTTLNASPVVRRLSPQSFIVYDAHNVDSYLAGEKEGSMHDPENYRITRDAESSLYKLVDGVVTCSDGDLRQFRSINKGPLKGAVIPNGVEIRPDLQPLDVDSQHKQIIFCGSLDYAPNREGLLWFCKKVLPQLVTTFPLLQLMVVGKGETGKELEQALKHPAIVNYGRVNSVDPYYQKASLAVVPLHTGSGTRLKVLEAMSRKVPVVSTSKGAEGIAYTAGENICIADSEQVFLESIIQILNHRNMASLIADEAYKLVREQYDWQVIGHKLFKVLDNRFN